MLIEWGVEKRGNREHTTGCRVYKTETKTKQWLDKIAGPCHNVKAGK